MTDTSHDRAAVSDRGRTTTAGAQPPRPTRMRHYPGWQHDRRADIVDPVFAVSDLSVFYGSFEAVRGVSMDIGRNQISALIGPSGCGKSTVLRCFNRTNDLVPGRRSSARSSTTTRTCTAPRSTPSRCGGGSGMVFQKPNPFPKSIYENIAYGPEGQRDEGCPRGSSTRSSRRR